MACRLLSAYWQGTWRLVGQGPSHSAGAAQAASIEVQSGEAHLLFVLCQKSPQLPLELKLQARRSVMDKMC